MIIDDGEHIYSLLIWLCCICFALVILVLSRHVRHPHLACVLLMVEFLHHQILKLSLSSLFLNHNYTDGWAVCQVAFLCEWEAEVEAKQSFVLIGVKVWNKVEPIQYNTALSLFLWLQTLFLCLFSPQQVTRFTCYYLISLKLSSALLLCLSSWSA